MLLSDINPMVIIGVIGLVLLYAKGYIKLPESLRRTTPVAPPHLAPPPPVSDTTHGTVTPQEAFTLDRLDSHTLGTYFAIAARREAEANLAANIAAATNAQLQGMFTAPFAPPSPVGAPQPGTPPAAPTP